MLCLYACMHACMNVSLTPVYSRLLRISKSASPLALPPVHSMNPVLIPHREGPKKRCWGHAGRMVPREVSLTRGCHMGCSGVNRVSWDAYLVRKEVNRSFLLIETHPNSPFFLAFFGPRATVVHCFWKGDCYIRDLGESSCSHFDQLRYTSLHSFFMTSYLANIRTLVNQSYQNSYLTIFEMIILLLATGFFELESCRFFRRYQLEKCDILSEIGVPTDLSYQYFDDPFTSWKGRIGQIDLVSSRNKSSGSRMHFKVEKTYKVPVLYLEHGSNSVRPWRTGWLESLHRSKSVVNWYPKFETQPFGWWRFPAATFWKENPSHGSDCCQKKACAPPWWQHTFSTRSKPYLTHHPGQQWQTLRGSELFWILQVFNCTTSKTNSGTLRKMGVSKNNGAPKSSILIGFCIINHPFWGTPIFGNIQICPSYCR